MSEVVRGYGLHSAGCQRNSGLAVLNSLPLILPNIFRRKFKTCQCMMNEYAWHFLVILTPFASVWTYLFIFLNAETAYLQNRMTSAVSLCLFVLLEVQTYTIFYRTGTNCSLFVVVFNILCYFVHQRLLVPFGLGVLLSCMFVWLCLLSFYMYAQS